MSISSKELLKRALIHGLSLKYENELKNCCVPSHCSYEHIKKINTIIKKDYKSAQKKKLIIAILVASAIALTGCSVYINRSKIVKFIETICEKYVAITYDIPNNGNTLGEYYSLSYVPDGYIISNEVCNDLIISYEWTNENQDYLYFEQVPIGGTGLIFDSEHGNVVVYTYKDYEIYHRIVDSKHYYLWNDKKYAMTIISSNPISENELHKMIDSLFVEKKVHSKSK